MSFEDNNWQKLKGTPIEFLYVDDNGNTETVPSNGVVVKQEIGQISVKKAMLSHFSRYAFGR